MAVVRPTATVALILDAHPGDRAAWAVLAEKERRLTRATARVPEPTAEQVEDIEDVRAKMRALEDTIASGTITVTVRGLSRGEYRNLLKNHPPKPDDPLDERFGYDADTFGADLLRAATIEAVDHNGNPIPLDVDTWVDDDNGVGPADFQRWFTTAQTLNNRGVDQSPRRRAS